MEGCWVGGRKESKKKRLEKIDGSVFGCRETLGKKNFLQASRVAVNVGQCYPSNGLTLKDIGVCKK
jgi:hypothetical protein